MRELSWEELRIGMILEQDVRNRANQLIISEGTVLTEYVIKQLRRFSISKVSIMDDIPPKISSSEETSNKYEVFTKEYNRGVQVFQNSLNDIAENKIKIDIDNMYEDMMTLINEGTKINVMDMISNLRQYNDTTYVHSVNVSIICNVLAKWLDFSEEDIKTATMCGLFHDIGKINIPSEIIKKPGKLTESEFAIIKSHSREGYKILNRQNVDLHIQYAALMHHERCDGSGYPYGLNREKIDPFAKLVAIADVYDAMTANRIYREKICPFEVIRIFEEDGLSLYETAYIMTFLWQVADTYMNSEVKLTDGRKGKIIFINKMQIHSPTIQCDDGIVDLSREKSIKIEKIL